MINSRLKQLQNNDVILVALTFLSVVVLLPLPIAKVHQVFCQPEQMQLAVHMWRLCTLVEFIDNMMRKVILPSWAF